MTLYSLMRPLVHALPPEAAHNAALCALRHHLIPAPAVRPQEVLKQQMWGLDFDNPVGLAAGFDKNGVAAAPLLAQGFGFVECGTVTPLAQPGNEKPRLFRLREDEAVINRLGFNNGGLEPFVRNLQARKHARGVVGANIGKNKDQPDAVADYVAGLRAVYAQADYVTVNISSPNTQGLRDLQQRDALEDLLSALAGLRAALAQEQKRRVPLLLKVAPDLSAPEREDIAALVLAHGIDGLIVSNTTLARPESLRSKHAGQRGGLSGKPLMGMSTQGLADFYRLTGGKLPLVGVGGIASAEDAYAKIRAGASLVQLYTALVYQGFGLVRDICDKLPRLLANDGFSRIQDAIGADARQ